MPPERRNGRQLTALRTSAAHFLLQNRQDLDHVNGRESQQRARYGMLLAEFVCNQAVDVPEGLLEATRHKLHALHIVRASGKAQGLTEWRQAILKTVETMSPQPPPLDTAHQLSLAMESTAAHGGALDVVVAMAVAMQEMSAVSSEEHGV